MNFKSVFLSVIFLLISCAVIALLGYERVWMRTHLVPQPAYQIGKSPALYSNSLQKIKVQKRIWHAKKVPALQLSQQFTQLFRDEVLAYWYGTPWDFYGMSQTPQSGTIACGYFVTTTLRDMGVPVARVRLAQLPSEAMIRELVYTGHITHLSKRGLARLDADLRELGQGVYVVGLDTHTGFIIVDEQGAHFIHASGAFPYRVVNESVLESSVLEHSQYRVVGKLTADVDLMQAWLNTP